LTDSFFDMSTWTDEEVGALVSMWPNTSVTQIATRLHRSREAVSYKAKRLHEKGLLLLEARCAKQNRPINPDPQDFDEVKREYRRKHHITIAELCARFEGDDRLAAELYRLAQAAKLTRLRSRKPGTGPSLPAPPSRPAP
jgi:predicted transcriptional regulator